MQSFAQTNIQLYNQMRAEGYPTEEISAVADAYNVAVEVCGSLMRGSGKTLLSHLVGTASILVWMGRPSRTVSAGLLHAAYEDGDFGLRRPRAVLVDRVGADVEALLGRYRDLRWHYDEQQAREFIDTVSDLGEDERDALLVRVVNELEDNLDLAPLYHGATGDSPNVKKGAPWRVEYARRMRGPLSDLARAMGEADLGEEISETFNAVVEAEVPVELRTGRRTIWLAAPRTGALGRRARQPVRIVARARQLGPREATRRAVRLVRR